jgi:hypothetical protein
MSKPFMLPQFRPPIDVATDMECINQRCIICFEFDVEKVGDGPDTDMRTWQPKIGGIVIGHRREQKICLTCFDGIVEVAKRAADRIRERDDA